jgi:hypothetical protein
MHLRQQVVEIYYNPDRLFHAIEKEGIGSVTGG